MATFETVLKSICEHSDHRAPWFWVQLANKALGNGSRQGELRRILHLNTRYWADAGYQKLILHWDKIIEDGLLPRPQDNQFLKLCQAVLDEEGLEADPLDYHRLAELAFGNSSDLSRRKIAHLVVSHRCYIELHPGARVTFHWDRIGLQPEPETDLVEDIQKALWQEYRDSEKQIHRTPQGVRSVERITNKSVWGHCYKGVLDDREDEDPVILLEGMPILVEWVKGQPVSAVLLVYDPKTLDVVIQFSEPQVDQKTCNIFPDTGRLLKGYKPFVERLYQNRLAMEVINGLGPLHPPIEGPLRVGDLRPTQETVVRSCLSNDVLFLWGPPGTGKTYTLAAIIVELALRGERVLATSISNRAVDELTEDVYERLSVSEEGKRLLQSRRALRLGFAGTEVLEHDELFPHRAEASRVRMEIVRIKKERDRCKDVEQRARLQQELTLLEDSLASIVKGSLGIASIVFTTVAQVSLIKEFRACEPGSKAYEKITRAFDSVVCDEASMMNVSHLTPICWWGRKRVVIAGDYRQLGPVVVSTAKLAKRHLHRSLFQLEMSKPENKRRMLQLTQQSRMHASICRLVSEPFYGGRLETLLVKNDELVPPLMTSNRIRAGVVPMKDGRTRMTTRGSHYNDDEADVVLQLVRILLAGRNGSSLPKRIGIVTPYRAQAGKIRQHLKEQGFDHEKIIQIGTVHAFQGGEAEVIIWNLVDTRVLIKPDGEECKSKPGRLFNDITGERLTNVAVSRSQAALYVVGDIDLFLEHPPNNGISRILRAIREDGHVWTPNRIKTWALELS